MKLETERLILKPPVTEDIDAIVAVANDPWIAEMTLVPHPYLKRDALAWIARAKEDWEKQGHGGLAVLSNSRGFRPRGIQLQDLWPIINSRGLNVA